MQSELLLDRNDALEQGQRVGQATLAVWEVVLVLYAERLLLPQPRQVFTPQPRQVFTPAQTAMPESVSTIVCVKCESVPMKEPGSALHSFVWR
jgi:hypothetical protein